jgi:hypothetical protein
MTWVVVLAVGAGSFGFRLSRVLLLERISLADRAGRVPRHGGNAAITTLIVVSTHSSATGTASIPTVLAMVAGSCSPLAESHAARSARRGVLYACPL